MSNYHEILRAAASFAAAYGSCISAVRALLLRTHVRRLNLDWKLFEPRCHNIHDHTGESDTLVALRLDGDELVATGESGTDYPLGRDIDGQDNYMLSDPAALCRKASEAVEAILAKCIAVRRKATRAELATALAGHIGPDGAVAFGNGFAWPSVLGRSVTMVTDKNAYCAEGGTLALDSLTKGDLRRIIDAINRYAIHIHNNIN